MPSKEQIDQVAKRLREDRKKEQSHHRDAGSGIFQILGEDPNPDMSGPHVEPTFGFFEGTFEQVLQKALSTPAFIYWGAGGRIIEIKIEKLS